VCFAIQINGRWASNHGGWDVLQVAEEAASQLDPADRYRLVKLRRDNFKSFEVIFEKEPADV
jgi:hypothetical protein